MKTILVINDNSPNAVHASEFALVLAKKIQGNILVANVVNIKNRLAVKQSAGFIHENIFGEQPISRTLKHLKLLDNIQTSFVPEIEEFDISNMDENKLAELINKNRIWMVVKGIAETLPADASKRNLNIHSVLNKILCPVLLIPENWSVKPIERLVYIADLRYCRTQIVRYLAELAKPWQAALSIAHLTAEGLPDMSESYALSLFSEEICQNVNYDQLYFNNIREKDVARAVDVIIHGMQNDLLVLVNRHFHFEEILGRYITEPLPPSITIPLLIFPC